MANTAALRINALTAIRNANSLSVLEDQRIALLGKKGAVTEALKGLGALPPEERKAAGAAINALKDEITALLTERQAALKRVDLDQRLAQEKIDVTLPARPVPQGKIHPVTQVIEEITAIFAQMGFAVAEGPDIEDDWHNFTALNIPESHPARQMHDTFYLKPSPSGRGWRDVSAEASVEAKAEAPGEGPHPNPLPEGEGALLLRTHTSPVQIRTMKEGKPPFRFIAPGATYRCDSDQTHTPMFHQVEGLVIEQGIHMGHLKGCIIDFLKAFFEVPDVPVRFRPSFFPFTEPSAEVDIGCKRTKNEIVIGVPPLTSPPQAGGGEGGSWLEVMGCGMVHPHVLKNCGIDPNEWQGFAFGMGVERLAMLKYGIPDLRTFFESDVRWLQHYGFDALKSPLPLAGEG